MSSSYILSSLEIKLINVLSDLLDKWTSKLQDKYRMHSWEDTNLNNTDRFYNIGWKDDYLSDLLKYLDKKKVLPPKNQIDSYLKENGSNGTINTISLYEVLVGRLQRLSMNELLTLKHYTEVKSSRNVYQRNVTLSNVGKAILLVSTIAFIFTVAGATEDITVSFIHFKNVHIGTITSAISKLPTYFIMFGLIILIMITIFFVALAFYNEKHLRYVDVIHQALADAYSIKSNNEVKK
ncbi:hypothetical protein GCM10011459_16960 [Limosilactobacillus caviae]|uniref:Uncharacterized protein n=1 Tax=Limosilactobacillus caviae TaxID=1769424 RepID=A0ABQ2C652_9LACO|nr:hypothetical protein GCM10011459_16960 [Limosilactobacillus caviae]